jgi:hypothetical protein
MKKAVGSGFYTEASILVVMNFCLMLNACAQRTYNQAKTKDLTTVSEQTKVTICKTVEPSYQLAGTDAKASVRVACDGQCRADDYRLRKFYLSNEEKVQGFEYSVTLSNGKEIRNLFVFNPENGLMKALLSSKIDNPDIQKSLNFYGLEPSSVTNVTIPNDGKLLLNSGTKASLSTAGLFDGGTLDCGGQPISGSIELSQFKDENLRDVKITTASP